MESPLCIGLHKKELLRLLLDPWKTLCLMEPAASLPRCFLAFVNLDVISDANAVPFYPMPLVTAMPRIVRDLMCCSFWHNGTAWACSTMLGQLLVSSTPLTPVHCISPTACGGCFVNVICLVVRIHVAFWFAYLSQETYFPAFVTLHFNRKIIFGHVFPVWRSPYADVVSMYFGPLSYILYSLRQFLC